MKRVTTDFHAHILPGADHGSDGIETSLGQLRLIASYGIERVVATPHFYPMNDSPELFVERRTDSARLLKSSMQKGFPAVMFGAEVLVCDGIERMEGLDLLTVYGTKCILLEMPMTKWTDTTFETVEAISRMDLIPVMAHIDRYDPKYIDELMKLDVYAQLNPGAFSGFKNRRFAEKWLKSGKVVAVGSDLHMVNEKEYRSFDYAVKSLGDYSEDIEETMKHLLSGAKMITG